MMTGTPAHLLPLAYTLHELMAYLMVISIAGHAYLGSFANPGTLGAPFTGQVTVAWLHYHHPDYQPKPKAIVQRNDH
jgi:cytochrome b subunit of formate dehydrogenase